MKKKFLILFVFISVFSLGQRGTSMSKSIEINQTNNISTPKNIEVKTTQSSHKLKQLSSSQEDELNKLMSEVNDDNNIISTETKKSSTRKIKLVIEEDNPVNSMTLFGKSFSELNETEKIQLKGKQVEYEKQKQEKINKLLKEKKYWARKKIEENKNNPNFVYEEEFEELDEKWLFVNSSKKELKEHLVKSIDKSDSKIAILEQVELSSTKGLSSEQLSKKQIEIIERQNVLLKKELVGLLNPGEYQQSPKLLSELKKNNAELKLLFPIKGLDKIGDVVLYKKLSDLISYNNGLKTKLTELLNDNFDQQVLEEFFKSSNILINFASN